MIHELRTYTIRPGALAEYIETTRTVGMPIRQDKYGVLRGYWTTQHGPLSRVLHLWEYPDLNARTKVRAEMMSNPSWLNEFIPASVSLIVKQENALLNPLVWNANQPAGLGIYELRIDLLKPGPSIAKAWIANFRHAANTTTGATNVALWSVEVGPLNSMMHLWRRSSQTAKPIALPAALADATINMESLLLSPSSFSPLT